MNNQHNFYILLDKYILGEATAEDMQQLATLLEKEEYINLLDGHMRIRFEEEVSLPRTQYPDKQTLDLLLKRLANNPEDLPVESQPAISPDHRIHRFKRSWFRYAAAIILIVGGAITAIVMSSDQKSTNPSVTISQKGAASDVPPGGDRAYLTLADGSTIILDSAANGNLATQGNAAIIKLTNGQITYDLKGSSTGEVVMNTMTTPKGGQYQLTLPDGSRVWLNAASSIQFPTAFFGSERKVKIAGEVFFEVAKNKKQPFIVDIDGKANVQVLGTSFNINSYNNEESIRTTLVDGSVKVFEGSREVMLKPGYQAVIDQTPDGKNEMIQVQATDIDQALAWKNGVFNLENLDVYAVTRQLERWYDIKVRYEEPIHNVVVQGEIFRNTNLSDVIDGLQKVGVRWRLEGKTLIVQ